MSGFSLQQLADAVVTEKTTPRRRFVVKLDCEIAEPITHRPRMFPRRQHFQFAPDFAVQPDTHRLQPTKTIEVADWFSDAPLVEGESNIATVAVKNNEYAWRKNADDRWQIRDVDSKPYEVETKLVLEDRATVRWLHRDDEKYRVAWSEQDEARFVIGRLRWICTQAADAKGWKTPTGWRLAAARLAQPKQAAQHAAALKTRWNFQHEVERTAGVVTLTMTKEWKPQFGRTYAEATLNLRSARRAAQRQPFAAVREGIL